MTPAMVLDQLRPHDFAVLSTVGADGDPDSAAVNYGVSRPRSPLALYVMTRRHLQKARNIVGNPSVSLVVPLTRRILWLFPPPPIQLYGRAEVLDWTDGAGSDVFAHLWMGRRILEAYARSRSRGETRVCFLKTSGSSEAVWSPAPQRSSFDECPGAKTYESLWSHDA